MTNSFYIQLLYDGRNSKCVATIIKKLDLLLFAQFPVLVFLHLLYLSFHHNHNQAT